MGFETTGDNGDSPIFTIFTGGVQLTDTDENNQTTTITYNDASFWRPASASFPDGGLTSVAYNSATSSTVTTKMNASQNIVATQILDGLGRDHQDQLNSDPLGVDYTDTTYDVLGRVASVSNPHRSSGNPTDGTSSYQYDALSRPTAVTLQDGSVAASSYANNTVTATDPAGKKRSSTFDSLGRITQVTEDPGGLGYVTTYSYDALGNLTGVTQNGGRSRTFGYDAMSRLTSESTPEAGAVSYGYDANSNTGDLTSRVALAPNQTGSATVTTTYSYDALHRLTGKTFSDGVTPNFVFTYDIPSRYGFTFQNPIGRMVLAERSCSSIFFSYDPMGRVINNEQATFLSCTGGAATAVPTYQYDLAGDPTSYTNGAGVTFTQSFDSAARATGLTSSLVDAQHPATLATVNSSTGYYPFGGMRNVALGNNLTNTAAFNNRLQPCRYNTNSSGSSLGSCGDAIPSGSVQDFSFGFASGTNNGNVASMSATGQQSFSRTYSYDSLNRLAALSDSNTSQSCRGLSWSYDAWGNRTAQTVTAGTCNAFSASVDTSNRLFGSPYQYDSAGNMTHDASHSYTYDAENRLIQVDGSSGYCSASGNNAVATACYVYDALGRRSVKIPSSGAWTQYAYDLSGNVVAQFGDGCGPTCWSRGYVYLGGQQIAEYGNSTTYFFHQDHLGSARLLTGVGSNLVSNPGFEQGQTNWLLQGTGLTVVTDATRAHSGSSYTQISDSDTNGGPDVMGQDVPVQPGDQLTFGGWVYLESGGCGSLGWWLKVEDANHNAINWINAGASPTTSGWTFQTNTYTVPSGVGFVALYATVWKPSSTTVIRVDDGFLYDNRTSVQIVQNLDYLPFGEVVSSDSGVTTHKFTGDERDGETGLDHTQFRKYSSTLGRWMTPDPAGLAAVAPSNPQSWNRYSYVLNSPLLFIDPSGLDCEDGADPTIFGPNCFGPGGGGGGGGPFGGAGPGGPLPPGCSFVDNPTDPANPLINCPDPAAGSKDCGPTFLASGNGQCQGGGVGGGAPPAPKPPKAPLFATQRTCIGDAQFSGVGGNQAPGKGALGIVPPNGSVAAGSSRMFGLSRAQLRAQGANISVQPFGLSQTLFDNGGPQPPFSVSDIGDINIRNSATTRFDIYRFPTKRQANQFGKQTALTAIIIPGVTGATCPAGFTDFSPLPR